MYVNRESSNVNSGSPLQNPADDKLSFRPASIYVLPFTDLMQTLQICTTKRKEFFMPAAVCLLPVVPMRKEPSHRSEMVSQLLFGEYAEAGEEKAGFIYIQCDYDGYEGWVQQTQLTLTDVKEKLRPQAYTAGFATPVAKNGVLLHVPYATPVFTQAGADFTIAGASFTYLMQPQQTWKVGELRLAEETLAAAYQPYLNAPYLWGGKSVWGTDCSGFVQQVFKLFGVKLMRDAYLQAGQGKAVSSLVEAKLGDLAFFQNEKGRVTHVGIVLNGGKIVHASGQVRIDAIDDEGIVNSEARRQTHRIHSIRRITLA